MRKYLRRPESEISALSVRVAAYLECGRLEHGFLRVRCEDCHAEKLVAFSSAKALAARDPRLEPALRDDARRMADSAALREGRRAANPRYVAQQSPPRDRSPSP